MHVPEPMVFVIYKSCKKISHNIHDKSIILEYVPQLFSGISSYIISKLHSHWSMTHLYYSERRKPNQEPTIQRPLDRTLWIDFWSCCIGSGRQISVYTEYTNLYFCNFWFNLKSITIKHSHLEKMSSGWLTRNWTKLNPLFSYTLRSLWSVEFHSIVWNPTYIN